MRALHVILLSTLTFSAFSGAQAQEAGELAFVKRFLGELQTLSISQNREYCGYFGYDEQDRIVATTPSRGDADSCGANEPPEEMELFASYHTHGAYDIDADAELPSANDMEADIEEELDGYISTPGGRIWFIDTVRERAVMLCGRNCTVSDPDYTPDGSVPVNNSYTLQQLYDRDLIDE